MHSNPLVTVRRKESKGSAPKLEVPIRLSASSSDSSDIVPEPESQALEMKGQGTP